jgi:hypothetical protein
MLSSVLRSKQAVAVNIEIMRAFVHLREILTSSREFAAKLVELQRDVDTHDKEIRTIFEAIRQLIGPPKTRQRDWLSAKKNDGGLFKGMQADVKQ